MLKEKIDEVLEYLLTIDYKSLSFTDLKEYIQLLKIYQSDLDLKEKNDKNKVWVEQMTKMLLD